MQELGGAPPPEMMGDLSSLEGGRPGLGRPKRPGDDLPDDHKVGGPGACGLRVWVNSVGVQSRSRKCDRMSQGGVRDGHKARLRRCSGLPRKLSPSLALVLHNTCVWAVPRPRPASFSGLMA